MKNKIMFKIFTVLIILNSCNSEEKHKKIVVNNIYSDSLIIENTTKSPDFVVFDNGLNRSVYSDDSSTLLNKTKYAKIKIYYGMNKEIKKIVFFDYNWLIEYRKNINNSIGRLESQNPEYLSIDFSDTFKKYKINYEFVK
jgi:hypothetical protein